MRVINVTHTHTHTYTHTYTHIHTHTHTQGSSWLPVPPSWVANTLTIVPTLGTLNSCAARTHTTALLLMVNDAK